MPSSDHDEETYRACMRQRYVILLAVLGWLGIGCGARHEYVVHDLKLERQGWDSLTVQAEYARRTALLPRPQTSSPMR